LVRGFERNLDVHVIGQKQRHVGQEVSHRQRLDVRHALGARLVGDENAVLAGREWKVLFLDFVPDGFVDPLGSRGVGGNRSTIST
jgi:hypothetical protein